jgi:two-component system, chemotaxis family, sensor kinase CheA
VAKDVNELVLDAFRVEHREQLEKIRLLLAELSVGESVVGDARIRDAFRLAHSFKGGARVCDLREAEQLGHHLEALFERLSQGDLRLSRDVLATAGFVVDRIEDWMTALERAEPLPDTSDALAVIEHVMRGDSVQSARATNDLSKSEQLRAIFHEEFNTQSSRLRELLNECNSNGESAIEERLAEAARITHTLVGAAAVVSMRPVELATRRLEQLVQASKSNSRNDCRDLLEHFEQCIGSIAEALATRSPQSDEALSSVGNHSAIVAAGDNAPVITPAAAAREHTLSAVQAVLPISNDTVRVSVESLDRLVRTSGALLAENQQLSGLLRQLAELQAEINNLEREREGIRRTASSRLHQLAAIPEFSRISSYLEIVDRQVSAIGKQIRQVVIDGRRTNWRLSSRAAQLQQDVHEARLVPAHSVFQGFRKMMRDLAAAEGKQIDFQTSGMDVRADRMILQELKDPLMHVLRNCASHGIERPEQRLTAGKHETGRVSLRIEVASGRLQIVVDDDGRGIDISKLQQQAIDRGLLSEESATAQSAKNALSLAFQSGISTAESVTELSGRGIGLSIVDDTLRRLNGHVSLAAGAECGVRVTMSVPLYLATHRVLMVACAGQTFAIPMHVIECLLRISKENLETMEGRPIVMHNERPIPLVRMGDLLGCSAAGSFSQCGSAMCVVILKSGSRLLAVVVDELLEKRDDLLLNLDKFAATRYSTTGILLEEGKVALVVQPAALIEHRSGSFTTEPHSSSAIVRQTEPATILIVDDSFTTRTLEKNIFEAQGYSVSVAVDGIEALALMRQQKFAAVVSDIEMPRMDGFALLERIKSDRRLATTPVILVTSRDRQEDQQRGLDLGAEAYIIKRKFDHQELLGVVRQFV